MPEEISPYINKCLQSKDNEIKKLKERLEEANRFNKHTHPSESTKEHINTLLREKDGHIQDLKKQVEVEKACNAELATSIDLQRGEIKDLKEFKPVIIPISGPKTLYLIESNGDGFEEQVKGVFSSRENAAIVLKKMNDQFLTIVERKMDPFVYELENDLVMHNLILNTNGIVKQVCSCPDTFDHPSFKQCAEGYHCYTWATDIEHAIHKCKLARDSFLKNG